MVVRQGDVWWCDLPEPAGSGRGFRRPVLVVQGDPLNSSRRGTIVWIPLTSNLKWADAPGNVLVRERTSPLSKDSVAMASQIIAVDRALFTEHVGQVSPLLLEKVLEGIDVVLDR